MEYLKDQEFACVGTGLGGGFTNTEELVRMKYKEFMKISYKVKWLLSIEEDYLKMKKYYVWKPISLKGVPPEAKIITSTWAIKINSNITFQAILNGR